MKISGLGKASIAFGAALWVGSVIACFAICGPQTGMPLLIATLPLTW